jgi:hypothetical protein
VTTRLNKRLDGRLGGRLSMRLRVMQDRIREEDNRVQWASEFFAFAVISPTSTSISNDMLVIVIATERPQGMHHMWYTTR